MNRTLDTRSFPSRPASTCVRRRAFSMVELLVVIAIIVALVGLLLVALRGAQTAAQETKTLSTMKAFANAAEQYRQEHGEYPGLIPDDVIANSPITTTQNALLALMGGAVAYHPTFLQNNLDQFTSFAMLDGSKTVTLGNGWTMSYNADRFGTGPILNGKQYEPYLSVDDDVVRPAEGSSAAVISQGQLNGAMLPDLIDAWGQPIIYIRRFSPSGVLVSSAASDRPQFIFGGFDQYLMSDELGELGYDQTGGASALELSILNDTAVAREDTLAQIIRNGAVGEPDDPQGSSGPGFVLISAGADGIYYNVADGPGTRDMPVNNIVTDPDHGNPKVVESYDDIRVTGGS